MQDGKIPKLDAILAESESEEEPDMVIEVPANKVKLMVGPGGERIKLIQRKSKCRVQARAVPPTLTSALHEWPGWFARAVRCGSCRVMHLLACHVWCMPAASSCAVCPWESACKQLTHARWRGQAHRRSGRDMPACRVSAFHDVPRTCGAQNP